jgi:acyl carrier protein
MKPDASVGAVPSREAILHEVLTIAGTFVSAADDDRVGEAKLISSGMIDSLDSLEFVLAIEQRFEIEFEDEELTLAVFDTPAAAADLVLTKLQSDARRGIA